MIITHSEQIRNCLKEARSTGKFSKTLPSEPHPLLGQDCNWGVVNGTEKKYAFGVTLEPKRVGESPVSSIVGTLLNFFWASYERNPSEMPKWPHQILKESYRANQPEGFLVLRNFLILLRYEWPIYHVDDAAADKYYGSWQQMVKGLAKEHPFYGCVDINGLNDSGAVARETLRVSDLSPSLTKAWVKIFGDPKAYRKWAYTVENGSNSTSVPELPLQILANYAELNQTLNLGELMGINKPIHAGTRKSDKWDKSCTTLQEGFTNIKHTNAVIVNSPAAHRFWASLLRFQLLKIDSNQLLKDYKDYRDYRGTPTGDIGGIDW